MKRECISRRSFLKRTAAAAAIPTIIPACALGRDGHTAPSERVVTGCIGIGDRGTYLLQTTLTLKEAQVVAVCDVKRERRDATQALVNETYENQDCQAYVDFQELLAREDIDACLIASPDHWHVMHALSATRAGKDTYVEKPLGLTVQQDQVLRKAVRDHERIFQLGTQQRSDNRFRQACELVRNGKIGELKHVNVWAPPSISGGPTNEAPIPEGLDYDRWIGPAPMVPYTLDRCSNAWWWYVSDYAVGFIAGWGIHPLDIALWGAGDLVKTPVTVSGTGTFPTEGLCNTATAWQVMLDYASGVKIDFRHDPPPQEWPARYGKITGHGTAFEGSDGWVLVDRNQVVTSDPALAKWEAGEGDVQIYKSTHHMRNFFECVKSRQDPISEIESAVESDIGCHISDIAIRLGRPLQWDPKAEQFLDDEEANARLSRPLRTPWDKMI
jgi:predicted dehydrogenase